MKIIQYFGEKKQELCGSDSVWIPDQRYSVNHMCELAHETPNNQSGRLVYFRIAFVGSLLDRNYNYVTPFIAV